MEPILDLIDFDKNDRELLERRFVDLDSLPSFIIEEMILEEKYELKDFSLEIAKQNKLSFMNEFVPNTKIIKCLQDEVSRSIDEFNEIEAIQQIPFDEYLNQYLAEIKK